MPKTYLKFSIILPLAFIGLFYLNNLDNISYAQNLNPDNNAEYNNDNIEVAPVIGDVPITKDIKNIDLKIKNKINNGDKVVINASIKQIDGNKSEITLNSMKSSNKAKDLSGYALMGEVSQTNFTQNSPVKLPFSKVVIENIINELLNPDAKASLKSDLPQINSKISEFGLDTPNKDMQFKPLDPINLSQAKKTTYKQTTDGCITRIDFAQNKAIVQTKLITLEDAQEVSVEPCKDSEVSYPLSKNYISCSDVFNGTGANARFRMRYLNSAGIFIDVGECTIDNEKTFKITEDFNACGVEIDIALNKVWIKSKKNYNDINGNPIEISPCAKSAQSVPMTSTACAINAGFIAPSQAIGFKKTYSYQGAEFVYAPCPIINYDEVSANCAVRIDLINNQAIKQSTKRALVENKVISQTPCADTDPLIQYQIYKSYSDCAVKTDNINHFIIPKYKNFYLANNNEKTNINDVCAEDTEIKYNIVEDFTNCAVLVDYDANVVRRKSATYYIDLDGNRHDLQACQISASAPNIAITKDTEPCSVYDDFTQKKSFQQEALSYIFNGQKFVARGCQNTTLAWNHEQYKFNDSGNLLCPVSKNVLGDAVIVFYRNGYMLNGARKYITQCVASDTDSMIQSTMDGCIDMNLWLHNFNSSFSTGRTRTYFLIDNQPKYLTSCADDKITYNHNYELQSWQFQDSSLNNYPLYKVYILVNGIRYNIKDNFLLSGAIAQPYQIISAKIIDAPNNTHSYQGCTKNIPQLVQTTYKRGDNSQFVAGGITNGTNRSVYACISQNISVSNPYGTASYNSQNGIVSLTNNNSGADLLPSGSSVYRKFQFNYVKSGQTIASSPINALTKFTIGSNWGIAWGCGDSNGNGAYGTSATYAACNSAQTPSMNPYTYSITLGQAWLRDDNQVIYGF